MPLLSRYFGFVREISFLSGRMKFRFAFDMFVFRNKKFDRSFALVSSIHPENSRERKEQRFSGFSSSFSFFSLRARGNESSKAIRWISQKSLYRLNFRLNQC